jgi:cyclic beta-1,2-glucan synthetase
LDNYYVVEEVLREIRHDLPGGYYKELPKLAHGPLAGYPRIFALALALIAHTDSSLDETNITRFVKAYQTVAPLIIGELWAVPTMFRLGLTENLRRLADQLLAVWDERDRAKNWIASLGLATGASGERSEVFPLAAAGPLTDSFIVHALQILRDEGSPDAQDQMQRLLDQGAIAVPEVMHRENHRQAVNQVSIGNCVTSLRLLATLDWGKFFEDTNLVEPVLREDPAGAYEHQDFATRDRYRQAVEKLARRSRCREEVDVARRVVELARRGQEGSATEAGFAPANHVGHYLIGPAQAVLKAELGYRPRLGERFRDALLEHPRAVYFGSIAVLIILFIALAGTLEGWGQRGDASGIQAAWPWILLVLAAVIPVSELAVGVVNGVMTLFLPPRVLPKLEFKEGIPADLATFVVMPSMLVRPESAVVLLERLEVHYLANPDPNLWFALLTDFADASAEHQPEDDGYLQAALEGVKTLNARYAGDGPPRFFLFHRRRHWNAVEGCWMGWERKRGKLDEFNRLLRGDRTTSYVVCSGNPSDLPRIRYVITLDVDTQLPRETARRLVGTLAHPLNRACFDPHQGRVVEGYGVLQPRLGMQPTAANKSWFTRIWASSPGIDPYATAVSDIYQDLFGVGTFTGKGIYEVDAFEAATGRTFPENHILSHDLIEGNYARCGLVTDIELFDDYPARYLAYARREHRWIRGDWQLLPWLGRTTPIPPESTSGRAPGASPPVRRRKNPLPTLERWKILDNLRRSLVPPALVFWLVLAWTVLPVSPWFAAGLPLTVLALPLILQILGSLVHVVRSRSLNPLWEVSTNLPAVMSQVLLAVVFQLNRAYLAVDAIMTTLARLYFSRRRLLEWETAASAERRLGTRFRDVLLDMSPASIMALFLALLVLEARPSAWPWAGVFLVPWFLSPWLAYAVSRPIRARIPVLTPAQRAEFGRIARTTWHFFETFVGDADHWLPPDNFQEDPAGRVAHRTSPTNQGLLLVGTLAAHDLGYVGLSALVERLEKTFATLDQLPRHQGHFFNWYDTVSLQPLQPAYVSTVDSGNLMGCCITLKQGLLEKTHEPIVGASLVRGLADTLGVVTDVFQRTPVPADPEGGNVPRAFQGLLQTLGRQLQEEPADLTGWQDWLRRLGRQADQLPGQARRLADVLGPGAQKLEFWAQAFARQVRERADELANLAPWVSLLRDRPMDEEQAPAALADGSAEGGWAMTVGRLSTIFQLAAFEEDKEKLLNDLSALEEQPFLAEKRKAWLGRVRAGLQASTALGLLGRYRQLADRAAGLAVAMDFRFLYKPDRHLFAIGYNVTQARLDEASYDLLASEARLASFLAIARGDAPRRHWFFLGRLFTRVGTRLCLLSWGGTMFEYLMPQLFLRSYPGTLLAESCRTAVDRQMSYGRQRGVPWGISESAFSIRSADKDYQYQSFGVPGLGLKRGLDQDLVIAPYATVLAALVRPHEALENLRRLAAEEAAGAYGFYEAVDFTPGRLAPGQQRVVVRCFMAHHQGMSLVALANCLLGNPMPRRFHAEPMVRATELFLQERVPSAAALVEPSDHEPLPQVQNPEGPTLVSRRLTTPFTPAPRTHLLSNGTYSVLVTNAGSGYSRWGNLDVTRWREDVTCDATGQFCYIRDLGTGLFWSAGHHPVGRIAEQYEVVYSADKAEFRRLDGPIATHLEVLVSSENPAEIRRLTLTNHDRQVHELELTSYAEIVLEPHPADLVHPAFGKLFLETEWVPQQAALLCRRRPRSPDQPPVWAMHVAVVEGPVEGNAEFETDRARFLGRGRTLSFPAALAPGIGLSNTAGPVLDPIFSLRRRLRLTPGASASVAFCTAVASSREEALALADHYSAPHAILRNLDLAWAHSQVELRHLRLSTAEAHLCQRLASHLLFARPALRAAPDVLARNRQGTTALWRFGISGDRPILLARIAKDTELALVQQLLTAHTYWRLRSLEVDLVILCDEPGGYIEEVYRLLQNAIRASEARDLVEKPGGVFLRKAAQVPEENQVLLQASASVVLAGNRGTLTAQLDRAEQTGAFPPSSTRKRPPRRPAKETGNDVMQLPPDLLFTNGLGGFTPDGREYWILPYRRAAPTERQASGDRPGREIAWSLFLPPAPWINAVANPACGFLVSESGLGCTWVGNSQLYRLTPWSNDPVADPPAEAVYLRDEATGVVWTPTPLPLGLAAPTRVRHGQGYTVFERQSQHLRQELVVFVPLEDSVKLIMLRVSNTWDRPCRLAATYFAEWVLGTLRDRAPMQVVTAIDSDTGALWARNPFNQDFAGQVAFADVNLRPRTVTADRTEFLGRNGSLSAPAALEREELSGHVGPGLDPCAALQVRFELRPGEEKEVIFLLGAGRDLSAARQLIQKYRAPGFARQALDKVKSHWDQILAAVQVRTPNRALDLLVNRWLLYQVLSCRVWGRCGFYQSSGAYGFRDQLQDVMALIYAAPQEARAHILRAASRQFLEGDVQHWWHPPAGRGVRTRIVDDALWLPFVVSHYVTATGDAALLEERVPYLRAGELSPGQNEEYGLPEQAEETGTVYEHCVRGLRHGLRFGAHGLPLMGTGDWNDGMNRVGVEGKGESVWAGWFLLTCLHRFAELADRRADGPWAATCRAEADRLRQSLEDNAWDGGWYRRAYFDDGTPLGSAQNDECQIDSIPQTWAVLSGAADPARGRQAMAAVEERLVQHEHRLIRLLHPPFDQGTLQPGSIKGYLPGIRENGGQYTHAAAWVVQAAAQLGQGSRAAELFDLLNPILHAANPEAVARYRVEPYVMAGDVYGEPPHAGRGGWTWYTGSAAWLYRVALESILGFRLRGDRLTLQPCIPGSWSGFEITFRYGSTTYHVEILRAAGHSVREVFLDGQPLVGNEIPLQDDGRLHKVRIVLE